MTFILTMNIRKFVFIIVYLLFCLCEISNGLPTTKNSPSSCLPYEDITVDVGKRLQLTPLIQSGQINKAQGLAHVKNEQMELIAPSFSGFLSVNEKYQSNMFFWYFPAKNNPETAPIVLWLNGGPGESSIQTIFLEPGPFSFSVESCKLISRNNSWNIDYHVLYIDNPVGVGFSYTENEEGYAKNQIDVGNNLYEAMKQFFTLFPHLQINDFYIYGVSYGGKYVPALGYAIHTKNPNDNPKINLKGLLIDSGIIDTINQINYSEFLYQIGLIDENGKEEFSKYESKTIECIKQKDFPCAINNLQSMMTRNQSSLYYNYTGLIGPHNYLTQNNDKKNDNSMITFFNSTTVRRDIHVSNYTFYPSSDKVFNYLKLDIVDSVADWVVELLSHYRIILFYGQLDALCAFPLLENAIKNWKFSGFEEYKNAKRHIWRVDSDIAGYINQGGNLTTVLVRSSGHGTAYFQPKWTLNLIKRFMAHDLLSD